MDGVRHFLDAESLSRLRALQVRSRYAVEGASVGGHRSRRKGVSVEFADYRQYVPGDDLKRIDWRVFGKSERLYLRQSEEETCLQVQLFVDKSASMGYAGDEKKPTKYRFACTMAAAIAYAVTRRQDAAGLALFDEQCRFFLPPKTGAEHLRNLCNTMHEGETGEGTAMAGSLHTLAERVHRRGLVILFSDFLDDMDTVSAALSHFRRRGHDVVVYHILDRTELEFPFRVTGCFEDMENGERVIATPREIREGYRREVDDFCKHCHQICTTLGAEYHLTITDEKIVDLLIRHWGSRN